MTQIKINSIYAFHAYKLVHHAREDIQKEIRRRKGKCISEQLTPSAPYRYIKWENEEQIYLLNNHARVYVSMDSRTGSLLDVRATPRISRGLVGAINRILCGSERKIKRAEKRIRLETEAELFL